MVWKQSAAMLAEEGVPLSPGVSQVTSGACQLSTGPGQALIHSSLYGRTACL